jgi:hypothetical protein
MKKILILIVLYLVSIGANSQNGKKFNYQKNRFGAIVVTPIFDQSKGEGKMGEASCLDPSYLSDVFENITRQVMTKEKVDSLYTSASFVITISSNGDVINCRFLLHPKDTNVISDDDFYKLYELFKKTKIDTSKVKIGAPDSFPQQTKVDYTIILGTLIPKDLGKRFNIFKPHL